MFVKGDTAGRAEAGRKGAARSAEVRRRKRALREAAQALLWHGLTANEADAAEQLRAMGVDDPTGADAVMLAQFVRACAGDTDAARFVRDTAGERPSGAGRAARRRSGSRGAVGRRARRARRGETSGGTAGALHRRCTCCRDDARKALMQQGFLHRGMVVSGANAPCCYRVRVGIGTAA